MERRNFIKNAAIGTATFSIMPFFGKSMFTGNKAGINYLSPVDNKKALVNPDMGWTMHYYSNVIKNYGSKLEPSDTLDDFPGLSTVYLRVPWAFIELEEGKFNWELLDTPAQRWIELEKKVAFRISAQESWMKYATPKWVVEAGAKGYEIERTGENLWEPVYDDPIFLEKVENFVKAMAARYDRSPHVAFVDVGHFGMWGEGHTVSTTNIDYPLEVKKWHIDVYLKYFKNTLLCISDDYAGHKKPGANFPITDYAFSKGVTIRDDSIMVQPPPESWYHAEMAQKFWPKLPVILEHQHYGGSVRAGAWDKDLFLKSVEDYHGSYMSIHWWPRILLEENRDVIDKINLRMGYRLQLNEIAWPQEVKIGAPFLVNMSWSNTGVAPCYPGGFSCLTLKDSKGGIVSVLVDESYDFRSLNVGFPGQAPVKKIISEFNIGPDFIDPVNTFSRNVKPGSYELFVSVGLRDGTPVFELPYTNNDGFKRYRIGQIRLN